MVCSNRCLDQSVMQYDVWEIGSRPEEKFARLRYGSMRLSLRQMEALRGPSQTEGVDSEESYVLGTLQAYYLTCFKWWRLHHVDVWIAFLSGLMQYTEFCGPMITDYCDSLWLALDGAWRLDQWQRKSTWLFSVGLIRLRYHLWMRISYVMIRVAQLMAGWERELTSMFEMRIWPIVLLLGIEVWLRLDEIFLG